MIVCGAEEPLSPNSQLLALDETNQNFVLGDFGEAELNRYSFVWTGEAGSSRKNLDRILQGVLKVVGAEARWIWCREFHEDISSTKLRLMAAKWKKDGWTLLERPGLLVAGRKAFVPTPNYFGPPPYAAGDAGAVCLLLAEIGSLDQLLTSTTEHCFRFWGRSGRVAPSREFVRWLADRKAGLIYSAKDTVGRLGIVAITLVRLDDSFLEAVATVVHRAPAAQGVWNLPP